MAATTCPNCGREHEVEDRSEYFGRDQREYVMYTCPENQTTYGRLVATSELDASE